MKRENRAGSSQLGYPLSVCSRVLAMAAMVVAMVLRLLVEHAAAEPQVEPLLNFRWTQETLDTLSNNATLDSHYGLGNLRVRFGLDLTWSRFSIHGLGQAAGAYSLPSNGSFGIGSAYFGASGGRDTSPGHLKLAELSVCFKPVDSLSLTAGRLGLKEGIESLTGDGRFDWIKRTRLSERLVGTWDWVNVGRRFDGALLELDQDSFNLSAFGARILQGGVDYDDAFEQLDGVDVIGVVFTSKRSAWVRSSEIRLFNFLYRDSRPSTEASLGERLLIDAIGASLVGLYPSGPGAFDLMLWSAYQFGAYGTKAHAAAAFIAEAGYSWPGAKGSPWLRAGIARAAGDDDPADDHHRTFFNMAPTNHKFYGFQDLNAFQNLINVYGQLRLQPHAKLGLDLQAHLFRLSDRADAWYGGSGPANNGALGYVARWPESQRQLAADVGTELDFTASWRVQPNLGLQFGVSRFSGGDLARALFPVKDSSTWLYFQVVLTQ